MKKQTHQWIIYLFSIKFLVFLLFRFVPRPTSTSIGTRWVLGIGGRSVMAVLRVRPIFRRNELWKWTDFSFLSSPVPLEGISKGKRITDNVLLKRGIVGRDTHFCVTYCKKYFQFWETTKVCVAPGLVCPPRLVLSSDPKQGSEIKGRDSVTCAWALHLDCQSFSESTVVAWQNVGPHRRVMVFTFYWWNSIYAAVHGWLSVRSSRPDCGQRQWRMWTKTFTTCDVLLKLPLPLLNKQ